MRFTCSFRTNVSLLDVLELLMRMSMASSIKLSVLLIVALQVVLW